MSKRYYVCYVDLSTGDDNPQRDSGPWPLDYAHQLVREKNANPEPGRWYLVQPLDKAQE